MKEKKKVDYSKYRTLASKTKECVICSDLIHYTFGRPRSTCSKGCASTLKSHLISTRKRNGEMARGKHIARAKHYGVEFEYIKPNQVFNRDGWKCQICGCDTPASLRGLLNHNAPSMDHIIPLSRGGTHTYDNIQTACRTCNCKKSNKINGMGG